MYKHILLPTDGSRLSERAALAGIALARTVGARITVLHVLPERSGVGLDPWAHQGPKYDAALEDALRKRAVVYLETLRDAALYAGVPCDCRTVHAGSAHAGIPDTARERDCDLIVMGSHGHGGDAAAVLGSETVKAVTLGTVPVLVHRPARAAASPVAGTRRNRVPA